MKKLFVVRHAKSSLAEIGQSDFDRPLSERGKTDAVMMAKRLKEKESRIDAFVSSPAKRARKTCKAFCETYGLSKEEITIAESLYNAPANAYTQVLENLDDRIDTVAVFGHNPGITNFANSLVYNAQTESLPTCAIFAASFEIESWKDFSLAEKKFMFFDYPKNNL